jgi:hypothetical protein
MAVVPKEAKVFSVEKSSHCEALHKFVSRDIGQGTMPPHRAPSELVAPMRKSH